MPDRETRVQRLIVLWRECMEDETNREFVFWAAVNTILYTIVGIWLVLGYLL